MNSKMTVCRSLGVAMTAMTAIGWLQAADLTITTDFPGGNLIVDAMDGTVAKVHPDERTSNGECAPRHWAFRVRNAAGRRYGFKFPGGSPFGFVTTRGPSISHDNGVSWHWMTSGKPENPVDYFEYFFGDDENDVIFAWQPLYTGATLRRFIDGVSPDRGLRVETLCLTEKGREAELLRLGREDNPGKVGIILIDRHHANEIWSSFVLEGVMKEMTSDSEAGRYLRENASIFIVPFVDKDGVEDGDPGKARPPQDHGRDYETGRFSTIRAIREKAETWAADKKLVIGFDFHACSLEIRGKRLDCQTYECTWRPNDWAHNMMFQIVGSSPGQMFCFLRFSELLQKYHHNDREILQYLAEESELIPGNVETGLCRKWVQEKLHARYAATCEYPFAHPDGRPNTPEAANAMGEHFAKALADFVRERLQGNDDVARKTDSLQAPDLLSPTPDDLCAATRRRQTAPSIAVSKYGRLWLAMVSGKTDEEKDDALVVTSSGDQGESWVEPVFAMDMEGPLRFDSPCFWLDPKGQLWLFFGYLKGAWDGRGGVWVTSACGPEGIGEAWVAPRRLCDGLLKGKPCATSDGRWLMPMGFMQKNAAVSTSSDRGRSVGPFSHADVPESLVSSGENVIVGRKDGSLWMLVRMKNGFGESVSTDGGKTWSEVVPSRICDADARISLTRLSSGNLLLVKHGAVDTCEGFSRLTAYVSDDDGKTWKGGLVLDARDGVSSPDAAQGRNGVIYVVNVCDRKGEKTVVLHRFKEEDVRAGQLVAPDSKTGIAVRMPDAKVR